jgi:acyl-CoA reductase-like NAD-dependent aldehyde dehydrogenase
MGEPLAMLPAGLPIGNGWREVPTVTIRFPYDGTPVAEAPLGSVELATEALDVAVELKRPVGALPSHVRRSVLQAVWEELELRGDELAALLVLETGKPLLDCRVEVDRSIVTVRVACEEVARFHGETVALDLSPSGEGMTGFWVRRPIGVVVGITGFNYPLLLAAHKIAPAVAAGCPVICKPAPQAPLAVLRLADMFRRALEIAGAPVGAVQVVTGAADVGAALVSDPRIGAVSFTGSAAIGHAIARSAAPTKTVLELGSNSAMIVADDADLVAAVDAVKRGGFYASGQACISIQRLLVDRHVAAEFFDLLVPLIASLTVGDPRLPTTNVSALIDGDATLRISKWIADAVHGGAQLLLGGQTVDGILVPTLLTEVPDGMDIWKEEVFGPVVCARLVDGLDEAISITNASRYGLQASVFTNNLGRVLKAVNDLEVGGVVINEVPGFRADNMPYGGVKHSGIGREGPRFAIEEFTVTRMAILRPLGVDVARTRS